ncbi:MAG: DUF2628 domain-containing protein, partial [Alphaproteobacteria bacterium]|nr:DUF2628 domain-containing protein [Alphaproteobacteria bacterium]
MVDKPTGQSGPEHVSAGRPRRANRGQMFGVPKSVDGPRSSDAAGQDSSDEELFELFVGPNASKFLKIYRAQTAGKYQNSINWVVFLFALPWFFYRKLYLIGVCTLLFPIILVTIFPSLAGASMTGVAVGLALAANWLYVAIALRRIEKVKALNLPPKERDERIQEAGGTSIAGAVFGTIIILALFTLAFIDPTIAGLPSCGDRQVKRIAEEVIVDDLLGNSTA